MGVISTRKLNPIAAILRSRTWPLGLSLLAPGLALANPTGADVVGGAAAVTAPDTTHTVITQSTQSAVVNWQQFNVGSNEYVIFNQPGASAAILNRIVGGNASEILGNISANGRVFLINPQGIIFGQGATIDVGSLVASTLNIKTDDFMAGRYALTGNSSAQVINNGSILVGDKGFVVLAGDSVSNTGSIQANLGQVVLASGSAMTLDMNGDGLVSFKVDQSALSNRAGVANLGEIAAQGGRVIMTAKTAGELTRTTVNNSGLIKAQGITSKGGEIYLTAEGGSVANTGVLDTRGQNNQDGGDVFIHADGNIAQNGTIQFGGKNGGRARLVAERDLTLGPQSVIDGHPTTVAGKGGELELSGHAHLRLDGEISLGKGGSLLIDPASITIVSGSGYGSDTINESLIESQLNSNTDVIIAATDAIYASGTFTGAGIDAYGTGNLTLGIGSTSYGSFMQGTGAAGALGIDLSYGGGPSPNPNPNPLGFAIAGNFTAYGGSSYGGIHIGDASAKNVYIVGQDNITAGSLTAGNGDVGVTSLNGGITLSGATATAGSIALTAKGGAISTGNLSASHDYDAHIVLDARDGVTTGALSVMAMGSSSYQYARLAITANNVNYGTPLGGAITVNGAIDVSAKTALGHLQYGYATASADFTNNSSTYTYDGTQPAGSQYTYRGTGGDITLNGAFSVSAIGQGSGDNADAHVNFYDSTSNYNYNTNQYFGIGGKISTQDISLIATATPHDNAYSPTGTTSSNAYLYATSEGDFSTGTTPAALVINASGGDANGNAGAYNNSSLNLQTQNGGDLLIGALTLGQNGDLTLNARSDRASGTNRGNIVTGILNNAGAGDHFDQVRLTSTGDTHLGSTALLANDIGIDANTVSTLNDLTALNGSIDVTLRGGSLTLGNLSASHDYDAHIVLDARDGVTTGALSVMAMGSSSYQYARLAITANNVNYGTPLGGAITVNGAIDVSAKTALGHLQYGYATASADFTNNSSTYTYDGTQPAGSQYTYRGTGGDITLNGAFSVSAIGQGSGDNADAHVNFYDSTSNYNYNTNQYFGIGGKISTQDISLIATATPHDNAYSPTGTTSSNAYLYATSEGDFSTGTTPAALVINASGGDANGNAGAYNNSSLNLQTQNGGDLLIGALTLGQNGDLTLNARSDRASGTNRGNIVTGILNNAGAGDHFDQVRLTSTGDTHLGSTALLANDIGIDANTVSTLNDLTALNGSIDVTLRGGSLTLGNLSATNSYSSNITLYALGGISTGTLTASSHDQGDGSGSYDNILLYANYTGLGTPTGGGISTGDITVSAVGSHVGNYAGAQLNLYNSSVYYDNVANQYVYVGGKITTGALNVTAMATAHDNATCNGCTTSSYANIYASAEGDIRTGTTPAEIVVTARGADGSNNSSLYLETWNGGDILLGAVTVQDGGDVTLIARSDRATGNDLGNITASSLSGGALALRHVTTIASGTINIGGNTTADDYFLDTSAGDANIGDVTTQNGKIDVTVRKGNLTAGNLTTHYGGISLDSAGDITTGDLSASYAGNPSLAYITLTANHDLGYGSYGGSGITTGDLATTGPINVSGFGGNIGIANATSTAGDIFINGFNGADITLTGASYLASGAGKQVHLSSDTGNVVISASSITASGIALQGQHVTVLSGDDLIAQFGSSYASYSGILSQLYGDLSIVTADSYTLSNAVLQGATASIVQNGNASGLSSLLSGYADYSNGFSLAGRGLNIVRGESFNLNSGLTGVPGSGYDINLSSDRLQIHNSTVLGGDVVVNSANGGFDIANSADVSSRTLSITTNNGDISGGGTVSNIGTVRLIAHNGSIQLGDVSGSSIDVEAQGPVSSINLGAVTSYDGSSYGSVFIGSDGNITANGTIKGDSASILSNGAIQLNGPVAAITDLFVGGFGDVTTNDLTVFDGSHYGDIRIGSIAGNLVLGGQVSGGIIMLEAFNNISSSASNTLLLNADALSAQALNGRINLSGSTLTIGTGNVALGADPNLLDTIHQRTPSLQLPDEASPNAAFDAKTGVDFGTLIMQGNYLYVRAPTVAANVGGSNLDITGSLRYKGSGSILYNVVPYDENQGIVLYAEQINTLAPPYEVTLALGSSAFNGTIDVVNGTPPATSVQTPLGIGLPGVDPPFNFVFLSKGAVSGTQNITLPGTVAVLTPPPPPPPTPTPPPTPSPSPPPSPSPSPSPSSSATGTSSESSAVTGAIATGTLTAYYSPSSSPEAASSDSDSGNSDKKKDSSGNQPDPEAPNGNSKETVKVKDSKPLDMGKNCK
jgi:filamentous hemagglutinin family protein